MGTMLTKIKNLFLHCGITGDEFQQIRPLVWKRNRRILKITSSLAMAMGLLFLLYVVLISKADTWLPYSILFGGSLTIFLVSTFVKLKNDPYNVFDVFLCYAQMLLLCGYAITLSAQSSNYYIPATSIVVFVALLPLSIDDRPIRMYLLMLTESVSYLVVSYLLKSPEIFSLDVMNMGTFVVIGMILYAFICVRNIREISQSVKVELIQRGVITALATVVEERDEDTGGHIVRCGDYVYGLIGKMMKLDKFSSCSDDYFRNVVLAAPLHDIGKIKIPDSVLNKPGKLTDKEYEIIKKHAVYGANIIKKTIYSLENKDYSDVAYNIAKHHHERYDGKGYPDGLAGEAIPLEARIMALADVYDALVSDRVYKKAMSKEEALAIIKEGQGTQFDPLLAELFIECAKEGKF